jgi:phosphoketolase
MRRLCLLRTNWKVLMQIGGTLTLKLMKNLKASTGKKIKNSFRSHHVPLRVMKLKKKEFKDLKQGSMTVSEYVTHFTQCDRTTSEMRGLSPKIISGDSRRSKNAQTHTYKHTVPYRKFKLKLLQIKCHV